MFYIVMYRKPGTDWGCAYTPASSLEEAKDWIERENDCESYEYVIVKGQIAYTVVPPTTRVVITPVKAPAKKSPTKKPVKKAAKN